jgi:hypothetical protein
VPDGHSVVRSISNTVAQQISAVSLADVGTMAAPLGLSIPLADHVAVTLLASGVAVAFVNVPSATVSVLVPVPLLYA